MNNKEYQFLKQLSRTIWGGQQMSEEKIDKEIMLEAMQQTVLP